MHTVLLALAVCCGPIALRADDGPRGLSASPPESVQLEILGVVPVEVVGASCLVLREKEGKVLLPIFIPPAEGSAIDRKLKGTNSDGDDDPPELIGAAIAALGGKVIRVEIRVFRGTYFRANVTLQQGNRRAEITARPSDSVALAMGWNAPIFATREVLDRAGLTPADLERLRDLSHTKATGDPDMEQRF